MKNIILILLLPVLFFSCRQNQSNKQSADNRTIVADTTGCALSEKNMKTQLKDYMIAVNTGKPDKALYYVYSDAFEYIKQQHPGSTLNIQQLKNSMIESAQNLKKTIKGQKVKYEFKIDKVTKRVKYKNNILCSVITYLNVKIGLDTHSLGGEVIAVSNDYGKNWKFFQKNNTEDTQGTLNLKFPKYITDQFLSKE